MSARSAAPFSEIHPLSRTSLHDLYEALRHPIRPRAVARAHQGWCFGPHGFGLCSPRRPRHLPPPKDVDVQMVHRLRAVLSVVDYQSVPVVVQSETLRNLGGGRHQVPNQRLVVLAHVLRRAESFGSALRAAPLLLPPPPPSQPPSPNTHEAP